MFVVPYHGKIAYHEKEDVPVFVTLPIFIL
jgi:hypothetical protein